MRRSAYIQMLCYSVCSGDITSPNGSGQSEGRVIGQGDGLGLSLEGYGHHHWPEHLIPPNIHLRSHA